MAATGLTNLQLELIKLFNYNLSEQELMQIKDLLAEHFANRVTYEADELWEQTVLNEPEVEYLSKAHLRTAYEKKKG
jgi:hypothetical protein